jgi:hypothetical protein
MCLLIDNDIKPTVAENDIKCYKVVIIKTEDNIKYLTYYREVEVELGETYYSKFTFTKSFIYITKLKLEEGLHSFKSLNDAKYFNQNRTLDEDRIIIECIIPKGAEYYEGDFYHYDKKLNINIKSINYASNILKYISCV